jgi:hypothetical protein
MSITGRGSVPASALKASAISRASGRKRKCATASSRPANPPARSARRPGASGLSRPWHAFPGRGRTP